MLPPRLPDTPYFRGVRGPRFAPWESPAFAIRSLCNSYSHSTIHSLFAVTLVGPSVTLRNAWSTLHHSFAYALRTLSDSPSTWSTPRGGQALQTPGAAHGQALQPLALPGTTWAILFDINNLKAKDNRGASEGQAVGRRGRAEGKRGTLAPPWFAFGMQRIAMIDLRYEWKDRIRALAVLLISLRLSKGKDYDISYIYL